MTNTDIIRTIEITDHIYAQGKLVARHPHTKEATIDCENKPLRGVLTPSYRDGKEVA